MSIEIISYIVKICSMLKFTSRVTSGRHQAGAPMQLQGHRRGTTLPGLLGGKGKCMQAGARLTGPV